MNSGILKFNLILITLLAVTNFVFAQTTWHNPLNENKDIVQGIALPAEVGKKFERLAQSQKELVRPEVWTLSQNTAGLYIEFKTNAQKISVRYTTLGMRSMPHMPSTGVSGVDLYVKSKNAWRWSPGQYSFKDTVTYNFDNLPIQNGVYRLYLPLYSGVKWMEIGVDAKYTFDFVAPEITKPIIVYGTSIAQGGCASRPGLAWPAIVGRDLNQPVINLAFSGNGRLEKPIIDVMAKVDAKLYILDCMPNLGSKTLYPEEELRKRVYAAVEALQAKNANTPILLVEHSGGNENQLLDTAKNEGYRFSSAILNKLYKELVFKGKKNLYLLTTKEIGFTSNSTVDGAHPNDIGMMENALAVEKVYKKIFKLK
jgi:lysophospholipase L1-like esterase